MAKKSKKKEDETKKVVAKCYNPNEVVANCDNPDEVIANCKSMTGTSPLSTLVNSELNVFLHEASLYSLELRKNVEEVSRISDECRLIIGELL